MRGAQEGGDCSQQDLSKRFEVALSSDVARQSKSYRLESLRRCLTGSRCLLFAIRKSRTKKNGMLLKPQDVLLLLKLVSLGRDGWSSYSELAVELGMSPSEVHGATKRVLRAQLASVQESGVAPHLRNLTEFLVHGVRYCFVPDRGQLTRGIPTAHAAPCLADAFVSTGGPPPVWPDPEGPVRGESFSPLYKSVPVAARRDAQLYESLALLDAVRGGRARERALAVDRLKANLDMYEQLRRPEH